MVQDAHDLSPISSLRNRPTHPIRRIARSRAASGLSTNVVPRRGVNNHNARLGPHAQLQPRRHISLRCDLEAATWRRAEYMKCSHPNLPCRFGVRPALGRQPVPLLPLLDWNKMQRAQCGSQPIDTLEIAPMSDRLA
jgi:hypothetical protein